MTQRRRQRPGLSLLKRYEALIDQILHDHRPTFEFGIAVAFLVGARAMRDRFVKRGCAGR
jgi:hypothetical protein